MTVHLQVAESSLDLLDVPEPTMALNRLEQAKAKSLEMLQEILEADIAKIEPRTTVSFGRDAGYYVTSHCFHKGQLALTTVFMAKRLPGAYSFVLDFSKVLSIDGVTPEITEDRIDVALTLTEPVRTEMKFGLGFRGIIRDPVSKAFMGFEDLFVIADDAFDKLNHRYITPAAAADMFRRLAEITRNVLKSYHNVWTGKKLNWTCNWAILASVLPRILPRYFAFWVETVSEQGIRREAIKYADNVPEESFVRPLEPSISVIEGGIQH